MAKFRQQGVNVEAVRVTKSFSIGDKRGGVGDWLVTYTIPAAEVSPSEQIIVPDRLFRHMFAALDDQAKEALARREAWEVPPAVEEEETAAPAKGPGKR